MYHFDGVIKILKQELNEEQSDSMIAYMEGKDYAIAHNIGAVYIKTEEGIEFLKNNLHILASYEKERFQNELNTIKAAKEKKAIKIKKWIEILENEDVSKDVLVEIFHEIRGAFNRFCRDNNLVIAFVAPEPIIMMEDKNIKYKKKISDLGDFIMFPIKL